MLYFVPIRKGMITFLATCEVDSLFRDLQVVTQRLTNAEKTLVVEKQNSNITDLS